MASRKLARGLVASGHPLVSKAAIDILEQGGNAFDAAVGAGFTSCIAEPALTSLGGGGFLLAFDRQRAILYDFFSQTPGLGLPPSDLTPHFFPVSIRFPGSVQVFNIGHGSVAVPGNLKGFLHVQKNLGRLALKQVLRPAVTMAREGVRVNRQQAYFLNILNPIMTSTPQGADLFSVNGLYLQEGSLFQNHAFADFLESLPDNEADDFYRGKIAALICSQMRRHKGLLTERDLAEYSIVERKPLDAAFGRFTLLTNPPPSFGGTLIVKALRLAEHLSLGSFEWGSPQHLLRLAESMRQVDAAKNEDNAAHSWYEKTAAAIRSFSRGTTHLSIRDREGNIASMTTSNGEGSGCIAPSTGIMLNNMMGEDDLHPGGFHSSPAGIRISSMMSPSLLLENGEPTLVLGSGGSKRIRTAIVQVLINVIDFGMDIETAILAPRIHWDGEALQMEPGFPDASVKSLRSFMPVNIWSERNMYFGGVHAISSQKGAADPRRGGACMATP